MRFISIRSSLPAAFVAILVMLNPGSSRASGFGGTLRLTPRGNPVPGACSQDYANVCPSDPSGTTGCNCQYYAGTLSGHFGNRSGRGSADLYVTIDDGKKTGQPRGCRPVFGKAYLYTPIGMISANVAGTFCDPYGRSTLKKLTGGFGASDAVGNGYGTISGSFNPAKKLFIITVNGLTQ